MMNYMKIIIGAAVLLSAPLALAACDNDGAFEETGEKLDEAADEVGDALTNREEPTNR